MADEQRRLSRDREILDDTTSAELGVVESLLGAAVLVSSESGRSLVADAGKVGVEPPVGALCDVALFQEGGQSRRLRDDRAQHVEGGDVPQPSQIEFSGASR